MDVEVKGRVHPHAEDRHARYKLPDVIVVVDALPLTAMEKLDRRSLAAMVTR